MSLFGNINYSFHRGINHNSKIFNFSNKLTYTATNINYSEYEVLFKAMLKYMHIAFLHLISDHVYHSNHSNHYVYLTTVEDLLKTKK